jgi:hypothetical protein
MYMVLTMFNYKGGFANFVGLTFFQPIMAIIVSLLIIFLYSLLGLPIRLNKKVNSWWTDRIYIPIILFCIGIVCFIISLMPSFLENVTETMDGVDMTYLAPNQLLLLTSWFLIPFSTLHLYPTKWMQLKVESILSPTKSNQTDFQHPGNER